MATERRHSNGQDALNKIYEDRLRGVPPKYKHLFGNAHKARRFITRSTDPPQAKSCGVKSNLLLDYAKEDPGGSLVGMFLSLYEMLDINATAALKASKSADRAARATIIVGFMLTESKNIDKKTREEGVVALRALYNQLPKQRGLELDEPAAYPFGFTPMGEGEGA